MKKYSFKTNVYGSLSAETAAKELERIRKKYGDLLPEYVVQESEKEDSVLHNVFEWNEAKAASAFRREQARKLIGNICVEIVHQNVQAKIRAFVYVRTDEDKPREFAPIGEVIANEDAYQDLLYQAKEDMQNFITVYSQLTELNSVKMEMLKVLNEIPEKKRKFKPIRKKAS